MKILDGHIHLDKHVEDYSSFHTKLDAAGVSGGVVLSLPPSSRPNDGPDISAAERIRGVMQCTEGNADLHPFYWIDPTGESAAEEVALAVDSGVRGFKVICSDFYPGDLRAMDTYRLIAAANRPMLFHSGILWDGSASSKYNRPAEFEALIDVEGLRFSLAHISWPWCDELIAVYGKLLAAKKNNVEMFIDTTPGTPRIYRREALAKLFTVGYDVEHNVIFGSDCLAPDYNAEWTREWVARDSSILMELGVKGDAIAGIFGKNLERFIGVSEEKVEHRSLSPGQ